MHTRPHTRLRIAAVLLLAGCGGGPRVTEAGCRETIAPNGQAAAEAVTWRFAGARPDRAFLDAYCAGVGPAVVVAGAAPERAEPAPGRVLVASWNEGVGEGRLRRVIADIRSGRLAGRPAGDFVLLLQEVSRSSARVPPSAGLPPGTRSGGAPGPGPRENVVRVALEQGLSLVYAPSMRSGMRQPPPYAEDRGVAVLSTRPLRHPVAVELPAGFQRRVSLLVAVELGGAAGALTVASVHLDNAALRSPLASLGAARAREARALAAALPRSGPLLLGGDLNTWLRGPGETAYRVLRGLFDEPPHPAPGWTARRVGLGRKLDYLLFRGGDGEGDGWRLAEPRAADRYGSDHRVLFAWLRTPTAATSSPR